MVADELDHRARELHALGEIDAAEDAAELRVFDRRVLHRRRHGAAHVGDLSRQPQQPVRQPAVATLERADAQPRIPVEHAAHEHERQKTLAAPRLAGAASHRRVVPDVAIAGKVRSLDREAVIHDREVRVVGRGPDRLELGVVHGEILGKQRPHRGHPIVLRQLGDRLCGPRRIGRGREHHALEPPRVGRAVLGHVAVIRRVQAAREVRGERGRAVRPRPGNDEVDVAPFGVHVGEPAARVVLGDPSGDRLARDHLRASREESAIAARVGGHARLLAGDALIAQLPDREDRHLRLILGVAAAGLDLDLPRERRELVEAIAKRSIRVPQQDVERGIDVRVGIDDAESLSHRSPPASA